MKPEQTEQLIAALRAQRRAAYRENPAAAERITVALDSLMTWLDDGMPGTIPVDLAEFGLSVEIQKESGPSIPSAANDLHAIVRTARLASKAGQSDTAADLWRQVLAVDPHNTEALMYLQSRTQDLSEEIARKKLAELRRKSTSEHLSELDDALRLAREVLTSLSPDEESYEVVVSLEQQVAAKRAKIKAESGEIESLAALGMLKEAIDRLERMIRGGRFEFVDRDGATIPTSNKLRELNQEYSAFSTQKAREYLARAELSLPAYPRTALEVLTVARDNFDRADPGARYEIEQRLAEVHEIIGRWEIAQQAVHRGLSETDPRKRLAQFLEARAIYSGVDGIETLISEARRDSCAFVTREILEAAESARYKLATGEFETALQEASRGWEIAKSVGQCPSDFRIDDAIAKIDSVVVEISKAVITRQISRHFLASQLEAIEITISQRDLIEAETEILSMLANPSIDYDLEVRAQEMLRRITTLREIKALLPQARYALQTHNLDEAEALLIALSRDAPNESEIVALQYQVARAKEQRENDRIEESIRELIDAARNQYVKRLFVTSIETLDDHVLPMVKQLPKERRTRWEVMVSALHSEISAASAVWGDYAQARTHLWEGHGSAQAENMREASRLLERVIQLPAVGAVMSAIQKEAQELFDSILLGIYMMQGDLEEVERRLIKLLAMSPHDVGIILSLHRVQATKYLRSFAEQADETRRMARREARSWYIASLVSGVIFAGLFVFAVLYVLLTRPDDTLSYLAPLYTFVPGLLSALFLKQYNDANQRLDVEQYRLWEQVKEFERKQMDELSAARPQPPTDSAPSEHAASTADEPETVHAHDR